MVSSEFRGAGDTRGTDVSGAECGVDEIGEDGICGYRGLLGVLDYFG